MKKLLVAGMIGLMVLAGCEDPTPTPTVSPIATPEAQAVVVTARQVPQAQESLTAEVVAGIVAALISILLEVVPGLAAKWEKVDPTYKRLAWLGGCLAVPMVVLGAGCLGLDLGVIAPACDKQGAIEALKIGFAAYFAGQVAYTVVGQAVRKARKTRQR